MICEHSFKPGIALIPVWGRLDGKAPVNGDTLNIVESVLGPVDKCEKCGETHNYETLFAKGKLRTGNESF
jgi:hypothetical protein